MLRTTLLFLVVSVSRISAQIDLQSMLASHFANFDYTLNVDEWVKFSTNFDGVKGCLFNFMEMVPDGVSPACAKQLDLSCGHDLLTTFLDATAKYPYTSLKVATRMEYGSYPQCVGIDSTLQNERIKGRYCLIGLIIPDFTLNTSDTTEMFNQAFKLGTCTPDQCSASDLNAIIYSVTRGSLNVSLFQDGYCKVRQDSIEYRTEDIVTIAIISICVGLMLFCTLYDVYLYETGKKSGHPLFLSFSVLSNGRKLLQTSIGGKEQIQVFHGIKTISMIWILAAHASNSWNQVAVINAVHMETYTENFYTFYLFSAYLAVDTFFYISGFLMSYQYLKQRAKPLLVQVMTLPQSLIHRYLRLTPAVVMLYLVLISIITYVGNGPIWEFGMESMNKPCRDHWWSFFLYVQNYAHKDDVCIVHTWYLSADMQMFLMGVILMIPISLLLKNPRNFKTVMIGLGFFNVILTIVPLVIRLQVTSYVNEYDAHSRLMLYFGGVMMGAFMRLRKDQPFFNNNFKQLTASLLNIAIWSFMMVGMFLIVIFQRQVYHDQYQNTVSIFDCLKRPAWALGLSWIIYSSYHGYGGIVNWFLSSPIMQIGGRLSYCMYLVHGAVIVYHVLSMKTRLYFDDYNMFSFFCVIFIWTIIISFLWTLAFESPLIVIERFLLGGGRRQRKPPPTEMKKDEPPPPPPTISPPVPPLPIEVYKVVEQV